MIFTTWNFGPDRAMGYHGESPYFKFKMLRAEEGRKAARQYAADVFNVCAAKRDYPYADHAWPSEPWPLPFCAAVEIRFNCVREFNRSNPGCEISAS